MLYLFDIDGTLVDTGGAGMAALEQTTLAIFGEAGPPLDLAGATDLGIVIGIHRHFAVEPTRSASPTILRSISKDSTGISPTAAFPDGRSKEPSSCWMNSPPAPMPRLAC